jgi:PAS domain S-box-containing protein
MPYDLSPSTIERTRADIATLRQGLAGLNNWLTQHQAAIPHSQELIQRVSELANFLERLNQNLEQHEKERTQLQGLVQVSRAVNSTLDLDQVLNRAMDTIIQVTRAERGFLMLKNRQGELVFQVARNMEQSTIASPSFQVSRSIMERVAESGQSVVTTDAQSDPRFSGQESIVSFSLRSILCVPLKARDQVIGVVYVDNRLRTGQFQQADVAALNAFADQAAIAIENAQLFTSVQEKMSEIGALKTFQDNIFASIASGVVATDLEDRITALNRAAESIFAVSAKESMGKTYESMLIPLTEKPLSRLIDQVKHTGARYVDAEVVSSIPERGSISLNVSVSSLRDAEGNSQGVTIVVDDVTEQRRLEATRDMFKRYLSPAVVDRLTTNPDQLKLGGQRQKITILFADIRGFTQFSESLPPEQLIDILNVYLSVAADAILEQEGTLDKFMGDAVMGVFNAPLPQSDHVLRAVRAGLAMRKAIAVVHEKMPKSMRLDYGIGIHTGDAVVGNVGTEQQMNYTAIGDAVNLAKRIQENAVGGQIIITDAVYREVQAQINANALAPLKVKGRGATTQVWELVGLKNV